MVFLACEMLEVVGASLDSHPMPAVILRRVEILLNLQLERIYLLLILRVEPDACLLVEEEYEHHHRADDNHREMRFAPEPPGEFLKLAAHQLQN